MKIPSTFGWLLHYLDGWLSRFHRLPLQLVLVLPLLLLVVAANAQEKPNADSPKLPAVQAVSLPPPSKDLPARIVFYWKISNGLDETLTLKGAKILLGGAGLLQSLQEVLPQPGGGDSGWSKGRLHKLLPRPREDTEVAKRWCYAADLKLQEAADGAGECSTQISVEPHRDLYLPVVLKATESSIDTRSILRFSADASWGKGGEEKQRELQAIVETQIGYPELQSLPSILSLPSFLLIPGVLAMFFFDLIINPKSAESFWSNIVSKGPKSLILAVTWSIVLLVTFYCVWGRNLLEGQSLIDILHIWLWSLIGAIVVGCLCALRQRCVDQRLADNQPNSADQPSAALRKAIANRAEFALYVPALEVRGCDLDNPPKKELFKSWHSSCWFEVARARNQQWLAPVISVEPRDGKDAKTLKLLEKLNRLSSRRSFWRCLWRSERAQLAKALIDGEEKNLIYLGFGDHRHPRMVNLAEDDKKEKETWLRRDTDLRTFFEVENLSSWRAIHEHRTQ